MVKMICWLNLDVVGSLPTAEEAKVNDSYELKGFLGSLFLM